MIDNYEIYQLKCKILKDYDGLALEELNNYRNFEELFSPEEFKNIMNLKQARKNKRYRAKEKFYQLLRIAACIKNSNKKIVFGTITLSDKYLSQKEDTYIRKIHSWLKEHFVYSILNKDFGTKTEREHYHFIGLTLEELESKNLKSKKGLEIYELKNKNYTMGFEPTLCLVNFDINDFDKTLNYLLKLNNHSNKTSTKGRIRIIKNHIADMIILTNNLQSRETLQRRKKQFYENLKNPSYDTLNKRSVSIQEIDINDFTKFLDSEITLTELKKRVA